MRKLIEMKTVEKDAHHMYIYENGKKTPIPDDGVVFAYLSSTGMLKATEYPDRAGSKEGKFVVTDEIKQEKGKPCINGRTYDIFGAGPDFVYLSAGRDTPYHTADINTPTKKVQTSPNNPSKRADCELLRQIYIMLK
jgi:hypothetical protein